ADFPHLAVIGGVLHVAFTENGQVVVKSWNGSAWSQVGSSFGGGVAGLISVGGVPHVLLYGPAVYKFVSSAWSQVGSSINLGGYVTGEPSITALGSTVYISWRERTLAGNNKVYLSHFNGTSWINDGGARNISGSAEAGSPSITNDGTNIWLAWAESAAG